MLPEFGKGSICIYADEETRTLTSKTLEPKSSASTNSATSAKQTFIIDYLSSARIAQVGFDSSVPPHKIDLQQSYPCVCPRKGRLNPIALTDALGCDRCASIFTVSEDGNTLVQLDSIDPFQGSWYWEGKGWRAHRTKKVKTAMRGYSFWEFAVILSFGVLLMILVSFVAPKLPLVVAAIFIFMLSMSLLAQVRW